MLNILITGGRAPAALEIGRLVKSSGQKVYVADSLKYYLSQGSNIFEKKYTICSPTKNIEQFINDLINIISSNKINLLIPTCEEVFFISKYKDKLNKYCDVFCDEFDKLKKFHNKFEFTKLLDGCDISVPETSIISSLNEINKISDYKKKVFKPVFSRFAAHTLIKPSMDQLNNIKTNKQYPWVIQQFIEGLEYCTYTIAKAGKINFHCTYIPGYRVGLGASIYFEAIAHKAILNFVQKFVEKFNYTGQIGFDIIEAKDNKLYVLECNPRATSGVHFYEDDNKFINNFIGNNNSDNVKYSAPKMISLAVLLFGIPKYFFKNPIDFIQKWKKAKDVTYSKFDKKSFYYQFYVTLQLIIKAIKEKTSLHAASSLDTEWNGEDF